MRLLLAVLLALTLAAPVSAAPKTQAYCSVSPNPVAVDATLTITASADVGFLFDVVGPDGRSWSWPVSAAGTVTYDWSAYLAGNWTVTVYMVKHKGVQRIGTCSFEVTP